MVLYTPGDLTRMSHALDDLLPDTCDVYRMPGPTGKYPTTPVHEDIACSVQMTARVVANPGLQGQSETAPTRFILRYRTGEDIHARDRVIVTNSDTGEVTRHTVESIRGPHSIPLWMIADISNPE